MKNIHIIQGFSKLSRDEKLSWLQKQQKVSDSAIGMLNRHMHKESDLQEIYGDISENTVSNYFLPLGLAPNFLINGILRTLPMVIEESSVIAAASHAAKFWAMHGGFHAEVSGSLKNGQIHFTWTGSFSDIGELLDSNRESLLASVKPLTQRMENRGGGIEALEILPASEGIDHYYQLFITFRTADAMGANFINSVLETMSAHFAILVEESGLIGKLDIIMSILSNYTPDCRVICYVEGDTSIFDNMDPALTGKEFADRFKVAVDMACHDSYRAVTHNKGIFNGMDAVIMATGNDYRAVEACGHAFASRNGRYSSLSSVERSGSNFRFSMDIPLAVGTVGGLTGTHPLAHVSLEILGKPSAEELMRIVASAGLATNFSAVRSLITTGIQKGHMRMHLGNILRQFNATPAESDAVKEFFGNRSFSHSVIESYLENLRKTNKE